MSVPDSGSLTLKQGVCPEINGAFTGAVSASMLKSIGVQWALAGHSERRVLFGETDEYINGQVLKLLELGMGCMLCIGESEAEYEKDLADAVCAVQLKKGLSGVSKEDMSRIAIAYEPGKYELAKFYGLYSKTAVVMKSNQ